MLCGYCKVKVRSFRGWKQHLRSTGCDWGRDVWVRHVAAKRRGSSGRRILSEAWPRLWKARPPMTEEVKARLREVGEQRIKVKKKRPVPRKKKGRRRGRRQPTMAQRA